MKRVIVLLLSLCLLFPLTVKAEESSGDVALMNTETSPVIKDISVSANQGYSDSTEFIFTLHIDESPVEIQYVTVQYGIGRVDSDSQSFTWHLLATENTGEYQGKLDMTLLPMLSRNLYFKTLWIQDTKGENYKYTTKDALVTEDCTKINADLDIVLEDCLEDQNGPQLEDFYFENDKLYTPGEAVLNIKAIDDASRIETICAKFFDEKEETPQFEMTYDAFMCSDAPFSPGEVCDYQLKESFGRYSESKVYHVGIIELTDTVGNCTVYSLNGDNKLEYKELEVVNDNIVDLMTSTLDENMISDIAGLEDGATAVVDILGGSIIPKALFDTIRGRNITVIFEAISSVGDINQGIQWIINGKDIINTTKDVDVNVYIEKSYNNIWRTAQEAIHGSQMPGLVGDIFPWEDANEKVKKELRDNGWGDVIPQIELMKRDGESFFDTFLRLAQGFPYLELVFADNGVLPCESTIRIDAEYALREFVGDKDLKLYFYNEQLKNFVLEGSNISVQKDRYYEIKITHNSTYALTDGFDDVDKLKNDDGATGTDDKELTNNTPNSQINKKVSAVKTGDNNKIMNFVLLELLSLAVVGGLMWRKRIVKDK